MHARNDVVEFTEEFVIKVQRPVFEDVDLTTGEEAELRTLALITTVQFTDLRDLLTKPFFIESVRLKRALRMIGDPEVLQAVLHRRRRHFPEGVASVTRDSVVVKGASQVLELDETG